MPDALYSAACWAHPNKCPKCLSRALNVRLLSATCFNASPATLFLPGMVALADPGINTDLVYILLQVLYAQGDMSSVAALSLGCRAWRALSLSSIYRRVTVTSEPSLERLVAFLSMDRTAASFVRILVIRPHDSEGLMKPSPWVARIPSSLALLMEDLEEIEFVRLYEHGLYMDGRCVPDFSSFASVHALALCNCWIGVAVLQGVVAALPALKSLTADRISLYPPSPETDIDLSRLGSPRLVSVVVRFAFACARTAGTFLAWLAASESRVTLRAFSYWVRMLDGDAVGHLLREVGPRLEELRLHVETHTADGKESLLIKQKIDVRRCTRLRLLELYDDEPASDAVAAWLGEARSAHLRTLSLVVAPRTPPVGVPIDLAALDARISAPHLGGLTVFRVRYSGPHKLEAVAQKLQRDLPATNARRILQVDHWP